MAILRNNPFANGLSGKIGGLVFKQYKQGTVVTTVPQVPKRRKPTRRQKVARAEFAAAVKYAKAMLSDREKKAEMEKTLKPGQSVYNGFVSAYTTEAKLARNEGREMRLE